MRNGAPHILKGLYLGGVWSAHSQEFIAARGIKCIINVTKYEPFAPFVRADPGIETLQIKVEDSHSFEDNDGMLGSLWEAVHLIHKHRLLGNAVLVHCHNGAQRSAAVVAAYLMFLQKCTRSEAVARVRKSRALAFKSGVNFSYALDVFHVQLSEQLQRQSRRQQWCFPSTRGRELVAPAVALSSWTRLSDQP